jgi:ribosomal protein L7/L12
MKFNLSIQGKTGQAQISLEKEFEYGEIEKIASFLNDLVDGIPVVTPAPKMYQLRFNGQGVDRKINAIKIVRAHTNLGLKEAKDVVEGTRQLQLLNVVQLNALTSELFNEGVSKNSYTIETVRP